jgi:hypothetical protein
VESPSSFGLVDGEAGFGPSLSSIWLDAQVKLQRAQEVSRDFTGRLSELLALPREWALLSCRCAFVHAPSWRGRYLWYRSA